MSDFSLNMKVTSKADIKPADRGVTFKQSMTEAQRQGEIQDIKNAVANAKQPAPYDSSLQLTIPVAGDPKKALTAKIDLRDKGGLEFANKMLSMLEKQQHFAYNPKESRILELYNTNSPQMQSLSLFNDTEAAQQNYEKQMDKNLSVRSTSGIAYGDNPRESTAVASNIVVLSEEVKDARKNIKTALNALETAGRTEALNEKFNPRDNVKVDTPGTKFISPPKTESVDINGVKMNLTSTQLKLLLDDPKALAGLVSLKQIFDKSPSQAKIIAAIDGKQQPVYENTAVKNLAIASSVQGGEKATVAVAKMISHEAEHLAHKLAPKLAGPIDLFFIGKHMTHSVPDAIKGDAAATAAFGLQCAEAVTVAAVTAGSVSGGVGTVAVLALASAAELCMEISENGKKVAAWNQEQKADIARQFAEQMLKR